MLLKPIKRVQPYENAVGADPILNSNKPVRRILIKKAEMVHKDFLTDRGHGLYGGVGQLTKVLAIEWGPYNVNVNAIASTATRTTINEDLFADEAWQKFMLDRLPVTRFCQPVDLVGATVFLASDASDRVTGITLPVDGGWTAW